MLQDVKALPTVPWGIGKVVQVRGAVSRVVRWLRTRTHWLPSLKAAEWGNATRRTKPSQC